MLPNRVSWGRLPWFSEPLFLYYLTNHVVNDGLFENGLHPDRGILLIYRGGGIVHRTL